MSKFTVGFAFYDSTVVADDDRGRKNDSPSLWRSLCCAAGSVRQHAVDLYQKGQVYTHCETFFPVSAFTPAELARVRMPPRGR